MSSCAIIILSCLSLPGCDQHSPDILMIILICASLSWHSLSYSYLYPSLLWLRLWLSLDINILMSSSFCCGGQGYHTMLLIYQFLPVRFRDISNFVLTYPLWSWCACYCFDMSILYCHGMSSIILMCSSLSFYVQHRNIFLTSPTLSWCAHLNHLLTVVLTPLLFSLYIQRSMLWCTQHCFDMSNIIMTFDIVLTRPNLSWSTLHYIHMLTLVITHLTLSWCVLHWFAVSNIVLTCPILSWRTHVVLTCLWQRHHHTSLSNTSATLLPRLKSL